MLYNPNMRDSDVLFCSTKCPKPIRFDKKKHCITTFEDLELGILLEMYKKLLIKIDLLIDYQLTEKKKL